MICMIDNVSPIASHGTTINQLLGALGLIISFAGTMGMLYGGPDAFSEIQAASDDRSGSWHQMGGVRISYDKTNKSPLEVNFRLKVYRCGIKLLGVGFILQLVALLLA